LTAQRPLNDLSFVLRVVGLLDEARLRTWLFGGWAEELRGLGAPREHSNIDLLYPGRDFDRVDEFFRGSAAEERPARHHRCSRTFSLEGIGIDLLLVQLSEHGWFSERPGGRFNWPADVFATGGRVPVASEAALATYREAYTSLVADRAA
jgi:hypothetical protein